MSHPKRGSMSSVSTSNPCDLKPSAHPPRPENRSSTSAPIMTRRLSGAGMPRSRVGARRLHGRKPDRGTADIRSIAACPVGIRRCAPFHPSHNLGNGRRRWVAWPCGDPRTGGYRANRIVGMPPAPLALTRQSQGGGGLGAACKGRTAPASCPLRDGWVILRRHSYPLLTLTVGTLV